MGYQVFFFLSSVGKRTKLKSTKNRYCIVLPRMFSINTNTRQVNVIFRQLLFPFEVFWVLGVLKGRLRYAGGIGITRNRRDVRLSRKLLSWEQVAWLPNQKVEEIEEFHSSEYFWQRMRTFYCSFLIWYSR